MTSQRRVDLVKHIISSGGSFEHHETVRNSHAEGLFRTFQTVRLKSENFESVRRPNVRRPNVPRPNVRRQEKKTDNFGHLQSYEEVAGGQKAHFTMPATHLSV